MSTYSQIYIQVVFAVKNRKSLIEPTWEEQLYKYITGIITNKGQKLLAINGIPNHIHILIGMKPSCCLSDLVREIKKSTTSWIRGSKLCEYKFEWQQGFGAFSYSPSDLNSVISYIQKQKEHHKKKSFKDEYLILLKEFQVRYNDAYLFEWIADN